MVLAVVLAMGIVSASARAHSELARSLPADGERVAEAPQAVELVFTEPVEVALSVFKVYPLSSPPEALDDPPRLAELARQLVAQVLDRRDDRDRRVDAEVQADQATTARVRLALRPDLQPGAYVVMWRVLSLDTHVSQGFTTFVYRP
ncbi:MAG TPA: copper resistance CopC family protein [Limnochordales bacterium]